MALNPVPQTGQTLLDTRDPIYTNFVTYIDAQFKVDHQEFNTGANSGKHNKVTMPQQPAAPAAFLANEMGLFVSLNAMTAQSEMNMRRAPSTDIPFTAAKQIADRGWSYLPSGLLLKWAKLVVVNPPVPPATHTNKTITFTVAADTPAFTTCYQVILTHSMQLTNQFFKPVSGSQFIIPWVTSISAASFNIEVPDTSNNAFFYINYLAIGV